MTLNEMADCVYSTSEGHRLNGRKNSKENFRYWFQKMFKENQKNVAFVMAFPDGEWLCLATKYPSGYDYMVPDTREQEEILWEHLAKNNLDGAMEAIWRKTEK